MFSKCMRLGLLLPVLLIASSSFGMNKDWCEIRAQAREEFKALKKNPAYNDTKYMQRLKNALELLPSNEYSYEASFYNDACEKHNQLVRQQEESFTRTQFETVKNAPVFDDSYLPSLVKAGDTFYAYLSEQDQMKLSVWYYQFEKKYKQLYDQYKATGIFGFRTRWILQNQLAELSKEDVFSDKNTAEKVLCKVVRETLHQEIDAAFDLDQK